MICERFPPEVGGLARSGGRIASSLGRIGCTVHVLAWSRNLPPGLVESEELEGIVLHRMGRFSNWDLTLQHSLNVLERLHEQHSFDLTWGHYLQVAGFLAVIFARSEKLLSHHRSGNGLSRPRCSSGCRRMPLYNYNVCVSISDQRRGLGCAAAPATVVEAAG